MSNPIQPLVKDDKGVLRFKENAIVRYILDNGGRDLNDLAVMDFSDDDRQQVAQLIGYSLSGYGGLSYVSDDAYGIAATMVEDELSEKDARIAHLERELYAVRCSLREPIARLYGIHPDDVGV